MELRNFRFNITALKGNIPKNDRILKLTPLLEQGKIYFPKKLTFIDYTGLQQDIVQQIKDEMNTFPFCVHDDALDNLSRIVHRQTDWKVCFPKRNKKIIIKTAENYKV